MSNRRNKNNNSLQAIDISGWIERKDKRNDATFCFRITGNYYILGNEIIPERVFDKKFPVEHFPPRKRNDNFDRTKNYMFNKQSY